MVRYVDEGVVPLTQEKLWRFLDLHLSDEILPQIHTDIVSQRLLREQPGEHTVERRIRFLGKDRRSVWKIRYSKPDQARWDILESDGPIAAGSYLENRYSDAPGGVLVRSMGEVTVTKFPAFLQKSIVSRALDHINDQDLEYLQTHAP